MTFHRCACGAPVCQRDDLCGDCWDDVPAGPSRASDFDHEKDLQEQRREDEANERDLQVEATGEGLHRVEGGL